MTRDEAQYEIDHNRDEDDPDRNEVAELLQGDYLRIIEATPSDAARAEVGAALAGRRAP